MLMSSVLCSYNKFMYLGTDHILATTTTATTRTWLSNGSVG